MGVLRCPKCGRSFEAANSKSHLPFCSDRCRQMDLGRWLGENYSLPIFKFDEDEDTGDLESNDDDRQSDE